MSAALPTVDLAGAGIRPGAVMLLLDRLAGLDPHSLIVARHGRVALRCAWAPYRSDRPSLVYSVSKTVTALAVGLLVSDGLITVDDPVDRHLRLANPSGLTIAHLLTMTTGHSRAQTLAMPLDAATLLATPPEHAPGTHFAYNSPASLTLSEIVSAVTGRRLSEVATRVFDPLGIASPWWIPHGDVDQGYSGLHLSTDDLARIAIMLADGGRFDSRPVVDPAWVDAMATVWTSTYEHDSHNPDYGSGYGYQVWNSRHGFRADGSYGQFAIAIPDRGLAIAYQGASRDQQAPLTALFDFVDGLDDVPVSSSPPRVAASTDPELALAARIAGLDAWTSTPVGPDQGAVGPSGWTLATHPDGTWTVSTPSGDIGLTDTAWTPSTLTRDGRVLRLWARGQANQDGTVRAEIVHENSPHLLVAVGRPGAPASVTWRTTPLWNVQLDDLAVPA